MNWSIRSREHLLDCKKNLNHYKRIEIIYGILSEKNVARPENNIRTTDKSQNTWEIHYTLKWSIGQIRNLMEMKK